MPPVPLSIAETGISETELLNLLLKTIFVGSFETISAIAEAIKLTTKVTVDLVGIAVVRHLLTALGPGLQDGPFALRYALSDEGSSRAADALTVSGYTGPAPVTLESYTERLRRRTRIEHLLSAYPPVATIQRASRIGSLVPIPDLCSAEKRPFIRSLLPV